jgi:hypothetical protein
LLVAAGDLRSTPEGVSESLVQSAKVGFAQRMAHDGSRCEPNPRMIAEPFELGLPICAGIASMCGHLPIRAAQVAAHPLDDAHAEALDELQAALVESAAIALVGQGASTR